MNTLDLLYDHYKDTYSLSKSAQNNRNKMFVVLCILESVSFLMGIRAESILNLLQEFINKDTDTIITLGSTVIQTLLWILILYVLVRYVQACIYIERQYNYIGDLEAEISKKSGVTKFNREGQGYLDNYPIILDIIDFFYKWFSPLLFLVLNIYRLVMEWYLSKLSVVLICDSLILVMIVGVVFLYLVEIHPHTLGWVNKLLFWRD